MRLGTGSRMWPAGLSRQGPTQRMRGTKQTCASSSSVRELKPQLKTLTPTTKCVIDLGVCVGKLSLFLHFGWANTLLNISLMRVELPPFFVEQRHFHQLTTCQRSDSALINASLEFSQFRVSVQEASDMLCRLVCRHRGGFRNHCGEPQLSIRAA